MPTTVARLDHKLLVALFREAVALLVFTAQRDRVDNEDKDEAGPGCDQGRAALDVAGRVNREPGLRSDDAANAIADEEAGGDDRFLGVALDIGGHHRGRGAEEGGGASGHPGRDDDPPLCVGGEGEEQSRSDQGNEGKTNTCVDTCVGEPSWEKGAGSYGDEIESATWKADKHGLELGVAEAVDDDGRELVVKICQSCSKQAVFEVHLP
jgi:hypothetical protein